MLGIDIDYKKRIFGFDLLRAFAIFCVVRSHASILIENHFITGFSWVPTPHGVDAFFVLSGFLLGTSFIKHAESHGCVESNKMISYWQKIIFRILPNYYAILILNYILVSLRVINGNISHFPIWRFFTFTQNLFTPFYDFFWESWSLSTQIWFYLMFPLLFWALCKIIPAKKNVWIIALFFICMSITYRIILSGKHYNAFWWDVTYRKVAVSRIDCIFAGVLTAWFKFYCPKFWKKSAMPAFLFGVAIFFLSVIIKGNYNTFYKNVISLSLPPLYISLGFPLLDSMKKCKTVVGKFISHISILSYSIYLLNMLITSILVKNIPDTINAYPIVSYVLYWFVVLVASFILYRLIEKPSMLFYEKHLKERQKTNEN